MTRGAQHPPRGGDVSDAPSRGGPSRVDPRGAGRPPRSGRADVVVTGVGIVSPLGLGADELWSGLVEGRSARRPHPPSPRGIAVPAGAGLLGEVADRARALLGDRRLRRVSRLSLYAVAAARLAFESAPGSENPAAPSPDAPARTDADSTGVVLGTSFGSSDYHFEYYERLYRGGLREASPLLFSESVMNAASGHVALHFGLRGPSLALVGGEEVGLEAIADAMDRLALEEVSAALAGGGEESCDFVQAALLSGALEADERARPEACDGPQPCFTEGAGFLLLERADEAAARGRRTLARLLGYGIARAAGREEASRQEAVRTALRDALRDADVPPDEVGLVIVSACDTDSRGAERSAVEAVLGARATPVVLAPKALLGEGFAFTSAAQAAIAVEALRRQRLPLAEAAPPVALRHALVVSVNRCGGAVAVVFGR